MTVRERILAIKLLEKQKQQPAYAQQLGVQVRMVKNAPPKEVKHA